MRCRNILAAWASRRYRGKHRHGLSVATIAARLGDWDDTITQIIPTPNVVRHVEVFDLPTIAFAKVPAWEVA